MALLGAEIALLLIMAFLAGAVVVTALVRPNRAP
jgi:hypothetical protein